MKFTKKAASPADDAGDPILWAAGNYMTPHRLAMQQMRAVFALLAGLLLAMCGGYVTIKFDMIIAPVAAGVIAWLLSVIYASALLRHLRSVERTLWKQEEETETDMDGDGFIGRPPQKRTLEIDGAAEPFGADWFGDDPQVGSTGLSPQVVRRFLLRAKEVGVTRSAWLPENGPRTAFDGVQVTRGVWKAITDWLLEVGWATNNGKGLILVKPVGWMLHQLDQAEAELADRAGSGQAAGRQATSMAETASVRKGK